MTRDADRLIDTIQNLLGDVSAPPEQPPSGGIPEGRAPHSPALGGNDPRTGAEPALSVEDTLPIALAGLRERESRDAAVRALIRMGATAVIPLLALLHDDDRDVRRAAAWIIGRVTDRRAARTLIRSVGWTYPYTEIPLDGEGYAKLTDALIHGSGGSRIACAVAFGRLRDARALPDLIEALTDSYPLARLAAIWALGQIGDPAVLPHLTDALDDPDPLIARAAEETLTALGVGEQD